MNLCELINILYPHSDRGCNKPAFLIYLVDCIMKPPTTEEDHKLDAENKYNPLKGYDTGYIAKMCNGSRPLPVNVARAINSRIDRKRFASLIDDDFSDDSLEPITADLEQNGIDTSNDSTYTICADLFAKIIIASANHSSNKQKMTPSMMPSSDKVLFGDSTRNLFIEIEKNYSIMDIINRNPPVMSRADSARFDCFVRDINELITYPNKECENSSVVLARINSFIKELRLIALTIDTNINNSSKRKDKHASINMDLFFGESYAEENLLIDTSICMSFEDAYLVADDKISILEIDSKDWMNYRNTMNLLYKMICE